MNIFICNRYDSHKEKIYVISPKTPFNKYNLKLLKYPFLKNLLLKEINNTDKNEISNSISTQKYQNSEDSEELQIIDYPYSQIHSNINLGNHLSNKLKKIKYSDDIGNSCYDCFDIEKNEEPNQIRLYENDNEINDIFTENNNVKTRINNINKFKLNDSEIDVEDTIKGEDNINISKLKSGNKNFGIIRKTHNINLIPKYSMKNKIKNTEKISLNNTNKSNINNITYNNNTFIKGNSKIGKFIKSSSKSKKNNTLKYISKTNIISKINNKELFNTTGRIDKNKSKKSINNNKQKKNLNTSKNNIRLFNKNYSNDNFQINNYFHKEKENKNNINDINNSRKIIQSIKKKMQKNMIYQSNNNISKKRK